MAFKPLRLMSFLEVLERSRIPIDEMTDRELEMFTEAVESGEIATEGELLEKFSCDRVWDWLHKVRSSN